MTHLDRKQPLHLNHEREYVRSAETAGQVAGSSNLTVPQTYGNIRKDECMSTNRSLLGSHRGPLVGNRSKTAQTREFTNQGWTESINQNDFCDLKGIPRRCFWLSTTVGTRKSYSRPDATSWLSL